MHKVLVPDLTVGRRQDWRRGGEPPPDALEFIEEEGDAGADIEAGEWRASTTWPAVTPSMLGLFGTLPTG